MIDNCPPLHSILSAIKTPSYNIAKHLVPILQAITNKFTIKNSSEFSKEVIKQDPGLFMARLDVDSLSTNRSICCDSLFAVELK